MAERVVYRLVERQPDTGDDDFEKLINLYVEPNKDRLGRHVERLPSTRQTAILFADSAVGRIAKESERPLSHCLFPLDSDIFPASVSNVGDSLWEEQYTTARTAMNRGGVVVRVVAELPD